MNDEQSPPFETVTKLEAAERQLRVAIRMFFERKDMIAIHTLATAALQILDDLAKKRGDIKRLYGRLYERFPPEQAKAIMNRIKDAQVFLKHADRDPPDKVLKFNPETTRFHLFEAAHLAYAITGRMPPENQALLAWALAAYPNVFKLDDAQHLQELSKTLNPDDFESILNGIDLLSRRATESKSD